MVPLSRPLARRRPVVEVVDADMARVLAAKTGAERLAIAAGMFCSARRMIESHLRAEHADWDEQQVTAEAARRLAHGEDELLQHVRGVEKAGEA